MPTLTSIENVGTERRARRLTLEPGGQIVMTAAAVVKSLGLSIGDVFEGSELDQRIASCEQDLARERALRMLSARDRAAAELTRRLVDEGYSTRCAVAVVERLTEVELVDDARFARSWVRSRLTSGVGKRKIVRELEQRGLSNELIDAVTAEIDDESEVTRARQVLHGRKPTDAKQRARMMRRLVSRGFDLQTAQRAVGEHDSADAAE